MQKKKNKNKKIPFAKANRLINRAEFCGRLNGSMKEITVTDFQRAMEYAYDKGLYSALWGNKK